MEPTSVKAAIFDVDGGDGNSTDCRLARRLGPRGRHQAQALPS
jgi:hypothetical protein